jgi:hypothetical protein
LHQTLQPFLIFFGTRRSRYFKNSVLQFGKVAHDNFPHCFKIDPKVLVFEDVTKTYHVGPQLIRMRRPKAFRQTAAGFPW